MKKFAVLLAGLMVVGMLTTGAWSYDGTGHPGAGPGPAKAQELTAEQKAAFTKFLTETKDLRRELAGKRAELRALQAQTAPDVKATGALAREIFDLDEKIDKKAEELGLPPMGPGGCMGGGGMGCMGGGGGMGMRGGCMR
jgi:hypothetical protein